MTDAYPVSSLSLSVLLCGQGTLYSSVFASFYPYAYSSTASFICCLFSLFNDIRSILDIQSHCVVMGASPLISTLFIHSHVLGGSSHRNVVGRHVAKGGGVMKLNG